MLSRQGERLAVIQEIQVELLADLSRGRTAWKIQQAHSSVNFISPSPVNIRAHSLAKGRQEKSRKEQE